MPTPYKGTTVPLPSDLADGPKAFKEFTDSLPTADAMAFRVVASKAALDLWQAPDGSLASLAGVLWVRLSGVWSPYRQSGRANAPGMGASHVVTFDWPFPTGYTIGVVLTPAGNGSTVPYLDSAATRNGFSFKVDMATWVYWTAFICDTVD